VNIGKRYSVLGFVTVVVILLLVQLASAQQFVRQCVCAQIHPCHQRHRQQMHTCMRQCMQQKLGGGGSQCFGGGHSQGGGGGCFSDLAQYMCTNVPGIMIDASEAFQHGASMFGGAGGAGRRGMFGGGQAGGGGSGPQCFQQCRQQLGASGEGGCARSLGCSLKRPPQEAMMASLMQCRMERQSRQQALCQCLLRSGQGASFCQQQQQQSMFGGGGPMAGNDDAE